MRVINAKKTMLKINRGKKIKLVIKEGDDEVWEIKGDEYMKPAVSPDKIGYFEVDYKDEINGLSILCRINLRLGSLIMTLGLKNNTSEVIDFDINSLSVNYKGSKLYRFNKDDQNHMIF